MRKISILLVICFWLGLYSFAFAHPPQDITISFEPTSKILKAVITHNVSNPESHFIKKVDIVLNGQEIIEHKISRQDNPNTQIVIYLIPDAKLSDTISVEAYCSISGKLKKEIKVTQ